MDTLIISLTHFGYIICSISVGFVFGAAWSYNSMKGKLHDREMREYLAVN